MNHVKLLQVAVNAYTRLLQHQVEADISESVVVNAIHPGSRHSKISQESPLTPSDAAKVKTFDSSFQYSTYTQRNT